MTTFITRLSKSTFQGESLKVSSETKNMRTNIEIQTQIYNQFASQKTKNLRGTLKIQKKDTSNKINNKTTITKKPGLGTVLRKKTISLPILSNELNFRSKKYSEIKEPPKILSKIEQLRILSKLEKSGLLSLLEKNGLTLSKIEKLGLLTTTEKLGLLPAIGNKETPGLLYTIALGLFSIGPIIVYLCPDNTNVLIGIQVVFALISVFGSAAAYSGANLLDTLQK